MDVENLPRGIDTNATITRYLPCLRHAGFTFVCRYLGHNKSEPLTVVEAQAISDANMSNVSIWEYGYPTDVHYFTPARGQQDGALAYDYAHNLLNQPKQTPIYFTVDYDAAPHDLTSIANYFTQVRKQFQALSAGGNNYFVGVYGNGLVCQYLFNQGLVHFTWLAEPTDWGGAIYDGWNIKQSVLHTEVCGLNSEDIDLNVTRGNGGGWKL